MTTVSPGTMRLAAIAATSALSSSRMDFPIAVPSMSLAVTLPRSCARTLLRLSFRHPHGPRLPDHDHADLSGILELGFDLLRDLLRQLRHLAVVNLVGHHDHAHLAPGLDREALLDAGEPGRDFLEPRQALDVALERLAPRARPRARGRVGRLHDDRDGALVRHVVMVRGDAVDDDRVLAVLGRHLDAELDVRALVVVRQH